MTLDEFMVGLVVWREARGEPHAGRVAVAWVVKTRAANPRWWGFDLYSVCTKPLQFSSITDPHDVQTATWPKLSDPLWQDCLAAAQAALSGNEPNPVPGADSYFADYIPAPKWAEKGRFLTQLGRHRFYNLEGVE